MVKKLIFVIKKKEWKINFCTKIIFFFFADLLETLGDFDEYILWIAQYLVMKRASIEPNFHTLYANFLEKLANERLFDAVLKETYSNIRILLSSDKAIANFSDRSLLKNLGHWLGLMTLAR